MVRNEDGRKCGQSQGETDTRARDENGAKCVQHQALGREGRKQRKEGRESREEVQRKKERRERKKERVTSSGPCLRHLACTCLLIPFRFLPWTSWWRALSRILFSRLQILYITQLTSITSQWEVLTAAASSLEVREANSLSHSTSVIQRGSLITRKRK